MDILFEKKQTTYKEKITTKTYHHTAEEDDDMFNFGIQETAQTESYLSPCSQEAYLKALKERKGGRVKTIVYRIVVDGDKIKFIHSILTREHGMFPIKARVKQDDRSMIWFKEEKIYGNKRTARTKVITLDLKSNNVYQTKIIYNNRKTLKSTKTNDFSRLNSQSELSNFNLFDINNDGGFFTYGNLIKLVFNTEDLPFYFDEINYLSSKLFGDNDTNNDYIIFEKFATIWYVIKNKIGFGQLAVSGKELMRGGILLKKNLGNEKHIPTILAKRFDLDIDIVYRLSMMSYNSNYIN